ncbi:Bax inhibitor-1/YccA family protein [Synechococcus elongatus]|uniref:Bax inhibitor-1/YccA family protein n=1 Tax=Synechococcus elongatus TaxID=32046 RepID=UPI000F7F3432|nr:Bax inhibitor-1 family protein [Synechococcus elongatus]
MSTSSNFRDAIREAQTSALVGPSVVRRALPFVGGGLVLTSVGVYGGLGVLGSNPSLFMPLWIGSIVLQLVLFFVAQGIASRGNNATALPLLALYGLVTGFSLTGLISLALRNPGVGLSGLGIAALGCGLTFILASIFGQKMSESTGQALTQTVTLGIFALFLVMLVQLIGGIFIPGLANGLELLIAGAGTVLFIGAAFVDFYTLPRTYRDDQYLAAALSMYLTYINLFIFILRFLIAISGNSRD